MRVRPNHPDAVRLLPVLCLLVGCSTEELVARDAAVDTGTDTSHPDVTFDAPFEVRPPSDAEVDDATLEACGAYCACMRRVCTTFAGYPYGGDEQCLGVCRAFTEKERTCWSQSCRTAEGVDVASVREHLCQHAWGTFGMNECPM